MIDISSEAEHEFHTSHTRGKSHTVKTGRVTDRSSCLTKAEAGGSESGSVQNKLNPPSDEKTETTQNR